MSVSELAPVPHVAGTSPQEVVDRITFAARAVIMMTVKSLHRLTKSTWTTKTPRKRLFARRP